jgi:hypothetical protein
VKHVEPLWRRALRARAVERIKEQNRSARSRLALQRLLARAHFDVSLVVIHQWSRPMQGEAYLWALAYVEGREDLPPPGFLVGEKPRKVAP